jgi:hypothetical protein
LHASTARGIGGSDGCGHAAGGSIVARYFMLTKVYYRVRWPSATRSKGLCMHLTRLSPITFLLSVFLSAHAFGETLGDARVGFSAERILVVDGRRYVGRMWHMPGEQRHEQELPAINPVFILHAGSAQGDVVLPQLHTVVEFALPKEFAILANPDLLRRPIGQETVNGKVYDRAGFARRAYCGLALAQPRRHSYEMRWQVRAKEREAAGDLLGAAQRQTRQARRSAV